MIGRELSRVDQGNGMTVITVGLADLSQGTLTVPTHLVDGPGYQDMLDAYASKHERLIGIRDRGVPQ